MSLLAEFLILGAGVTLLAIGVYGVTPIVLAWRRAREVRPLGVFNLSEAFPLLREDLQAVAPGPAPAPSEPATPAAGPTGLLSEVDQLHREVDVLRQEIGSLRSVRRRRPRSFQPAAALPAALRRQLVAVRHPRGRRTVAPALPVLPRRIA